MACSELILSGNLDCKDMKINTYANKNPEIDILEISGELTGRDAIRFEEYLYSLLDESRISLIINLKNMNKADGLGLNVLQNSINRGMRIRLFNVDLDIQKLLNLSGKKEVIKVYKCQEPNEAVSLFEKEFLEEKDTFKQKIKRRFLHSIDTSVQTEFISSSPDITVITYKEAIENLSEGDVLINNICALKKWNKNEENCT